MKVLLVSSSSGSRGGGELFLVYLGRMLVQLGHEPTLWCSTHSRMDELAALFAEFAPTVRAHYLNTYDRRGRSLASWLDRRTPRRLVPEWLALKPDVIHLNKQNLEDGLDLLRAVTDTGLPSVCTAHITHSARYLRASMAGPRDAISRLALRRYRGPIATSPDVRVRDLAEFIRDAGQARLVVNGVAIPDAATLAENRPAKRAELGIDPADLLVVAVARMVPQKRPLLFLEIAERIHQTVPEARFLWVGDGALATEWDAWVAARNLGAIIRRVTWQRDVPAFLSAADVFLHTAEFEGLPLAILEAMGAGLPCAITDNLMAGMPFLSPENSITVIGDGAWIERLRDRARLREIGQRARTLALENFSFERMTRDYIALYHEVSGLRP